VYPPTLLVRVTPLALLRYLPTLLLFSAHGQLAYAKSVCALTGLRDRLAKHRHASFLILSFPGVLFAAVIGQNSLLTAACA
ncbi:glycosyltransferase 87 family protein, partial [Burkholderia pseudomallei]